MWWIAVTDSWSNFYGGRKIYDWTKIFISRKDSIYLK